MEKKTKPTFTEEEKKIIYNMMIQIIEWQSESFSEEELKIVESIIKKIKNATN